MSSCLHVKEASPKGRLIINQTLITHPERFERMRRRHGRQQEAQINFSEYPEGCAGCRDGTKWA